MLLRVADCGRAFCALLRDTFCALLRDTFCALLRDTFCALLRDTNALHHRCLPSTFLCDHWRVFHPSSPTTYALRKEIDPLTPKDHYSCRTAPLTSKRCILYIYSKNTGTEYFKHGIHSPFFPLQNAVCFIILTYLFPVLFTFYIPLNVSF